MRASIITLIALLMFSALYAETDLMGLVKGIVVDEDSIGVQGVNIVCLQGNNRITGTRSDRNGRYQLKVPGGDYTIVRTKVGYTGKNSLSITVNPGDTLLIPTLSRPLHFDLGRVRVDIPGMIPGKIIVQVMNELRQPLDGVKVECPLKDESKTIALGETNIDGLTRFRDILPGKYKLKFTLQGYQTLTLKRVVLTDKQTLRLEVTMKKKGD